MTNSRRSRSRPAQRSGGWPGIRDAVLTTTPWATPLRRAASMTTEAHQSQPPVVVMTPRLRECPMRERPQLRVLDRSRSRLYRSGINKASKRSTSAAPMARQPTVRTAPLRHRNRRLAAWGCPFTGRWSPRVEAPIESAWCRKGSGRWPDSRSGPGRTAPAVVVRPYAPRPAGSLGGDEATFPARGRDAHRAASARRGLKSVRAGDRQRYLRTRSSPDRQ
jgi:hypothetical protein